jgi:hypothetical protein
MVEEDPSEDGVKVALMDDRAMERARERLAEAASGRPREADVGAALDRTRAQLVQLSSVAAGLEASLPAQVAAAVRDGVRQEAAPVGRQLAEVRGMAIQMLRRLEQLEADLTAERYARVDDLGVLVDLIGSGWKSVDDRLARIEQALGRRGGTVHRLSDRRAEI